MLQLLFAKNFNLLLFKSIKFFPIVKKPNNFVHFVNSQTLWRFQYRANQLTNSHELQLPVTFHYVIEAIQVKSGYRRKLRCLTLKKIVEDDEGDVEADLELIKDGEYTIDLGN